MAITAVRIHPALGVGRVGNSPTDWFVGPEQPWDRTPPPGGYKDAQCRVKRQAARFRLFAIHDDGPPTEVTAADGDISWTVHLANRKAISTNSGSAGDLTIDPGPRTLHGADQIAHFDDGVITLPGAPTTTVPLGEIRTDDDGRLVVLGGFGTSASPLNKTIGGLHSGDWYDDTSDGPVTASVTIGANTFTATGAWVVFGPPKFGAPIDNVIRLWDRLFDMFVTAGSLTAPSQPSYTNDIYPILQAAHDTAGVIQSASGHHNFTHPITNTAVAAGIFSELKGAGGTMPQLNAAQLTTVQHSLMEQWKNGTFTNDWAGLPGPAGVVTPDGMDKAALENAVGAAFAPGIEVGNFVTDPAHFSAPFRVDHATVSAGEVTASLSLPWQSDFNACGSHWWPVPRPNQVMRAGSYAEWTLPGISSGADMVAKWHTLGFVTRQAGQLVETDRCDLANTVVNLVTPAITFTDIAQGPMGMTRTTSRAVVFEVMSPVQVTLTFTGGPADASLTRFSNLPLTIGPSVGNSVLTSRMWVVYAAPNDHHSVVDSVTVHCAETGQTWTVPITANSVPRKTAAAALVLDKSGSMTEDRGDGLGTKNQSLREAATVFTTVMLQGDQVSLVAFNQDAVQLAPLTMLGDPLDPFDAGRTTIGNAITGPGLNPGGSTSIGDGIFVGRQTLTGAVADVKSMVVLTDGVQNNPKWISDVAAQIDSQTFAVGLGTAANTSAAELQTISGNNGGYLLVTGPITGDNGFVLKKFFLQILAGISNAEVVLDPTGYLVLGQEQRIPFSLTEMDAGVDVILLCDLPKVVHFRVQTPNGELIDPVVTHSLAGAAYVQGDQVSFYRITLPAAVRADHPEGTGTWQVLLEIPDRRDPHNPDTVGVAVRGNDNERSASAAGRRRLPYSVIVHAWSDIAMNASITQRSFEPGAVATIHAAVTMADQPVGADAVHLWAEVTPPTGSMFTVDLHAAADGSGFTASFVATTAGTYSVRVRSTGLSPQGARFQRERTVTVSVWRGGDVPSDPGALGGGGSNEQVCSMLHCLLRVVRKNGRLLEMFKRWEIDIDELARCIDRSCRGRLGAAADAEAALTPTDGQPGGGVGPATAGGLGTAGGLVGNLGSLADTDLRSLLQRLTALVDGGQS